MKNLIPRVLSGLIYALLIIFGTTGNPLLFAGLMAAFMILCFIEYVKITELDDKVYIALSLIISGGVFYYFSDYLLDNYSAFVLESLSFAGPVMFLLACFTILFSTRELYVEFSKATVAVIYISVPFSLAMTIPTVSYEFGKEVISHDILYIFALIWLSDTAAYFIGSKFGKRPLAPRISKNKSWEGAVGGFVFTVLGGFILNEYLLENSQYNWIVLSIIIAICAPIGDLVESKLKRAFNAKDSGKLIPGHGGFLDRLDSFIFVVPIVYLYILLDTVL